MSISTNTDSPSTNTHKTECERLREKYAHIKKSRHFYDLLHFLCDLYTIRYQHEIHIIHSTQLPQLQHLCNEVEKDICKEPGLAEQLAAHIAFGVQNGPDLSAPTHLYWLRQSSRLEYDRAHAAMQRLGVKPNPKLEHKLDASHSRWQQDLTARPNVFESEKSFRERFANPHRWDDETTQAFSAYLQHDRVARLFRKKPTIRNQKFSRVDILLAHLKKLQLEQKACLLVHSSDLMLKLAKRALAQYEKQVTNSLKRTCMVSYKRMVSAIAGARSNRWLANEMLASFESSGNGIMHFSKGRMKAILTAELGLEDQNEALQVFQQVVAHYKQPNKIQRRHSDTTVLRHALSRGVRPRLDSAPAAPSHST